MALTRAQIRAKLYPRVDGLGFASTADSVTTAGIVDTFHFQDDEENVGQYIGTYIYRPTLTGDDRVKPAGEVSTATLTHAGSTNYADTAATAYESVGLLHPDELNDCIRRAVRRVYTEIWYAVNPWDDGDFAAAAATVWTGQDSGTTSSKDSSTEGYHLNGPRSLLMTSAGFTRTSVLGVNPGDVLFHGGLCRVTASTATVSYKLYDETNGALILSANDVDHNSLAFQIVQRKDVIPTGVFAVRAQLQVAGTGNAVWDSLFGHLLGEEQRRIRAPSWLDAPWKLLDFGPAEYGRQLEAGRNNASSQKRRAWHRPSEFDIDPLTEDAAPRWLQINRDEGLPEQDLWVYGKRQLSDYAEMDDEADSTDGDEDMIMAACMAEVGETCFYRYGEQRFLTMWRENEARLLAQRAVRTKATPPRETEMYTPGGRR